MTEAATRPNQGSRDPDTEQIAVIRCVSSFRSFFREQMEYKRMKDQFHLGEEEGYKIFKAQGI